MRQFDVFAHPDREIAEAYPYLIILQADFVSGTSSVVAGPFIKAAQLDTRLYRAFVIEGQRFTLEHRSQKWRPLLGSIRCSLSEARIVQRGNPDPLFRTMR